MAMFHPALSENIWEGLSAGEGPADAGLHVPEPTHHRGAPHSWHPLANLVYTHKQL